MLNVDSMYKQLAMCNGFVKGDCVVVKYCCS
jgi:hypothetical protein